MTSDLCRKYSNLANYSDNNVKMFYENVDQLKETAVLVHFNWVKGHLNMAKMKEHQMWLLTPEEEE